MKKNILFLGLTALSAIAFLPSCLGKGDTPTPRKLTLEERRIQHINIVAANFMRQSDSKTRHYWIYTKDGDKKKPLSVELSLDPKQSFTILEVKSAADKPAVDQSKGILETSKLLDDSKLIIHRGSKGTVERDKNLYWAITTPKAKFKKEIEKRVIETYTTNQGEGRWLTSAVIVQLKTADDLKVLKWYSDKLALDIVAQSSTNPLTYVVSTQYSKAHPLLVAEILFFDDLAFANAFPFFYSPGWSIYAPKDMP